MNHRSDDHRPTLDLHSPLPTDDWSEPEQAQLRQQLGLRPTVYTESPDTRPCPPWCWHSGREGAHEASTHRLTTALHESAAIEMLASAYPGVTVSHETDNTLGVMGTVVRARLVKQGEGSTVLRLRVQPAREDDDSRFLTLSMTDAEELITVLGYLVGAARAADELAAMDSGSLR